MSAALTSLSLLLFLPPPLLPEREKLEAISLDAAGQTGAVITAPAQLSQERNRYVFGRDGCKRLGDRTLEVLRHALERDQLVHITAREAGETKCLETVTVFAP